MNKEQHSVLVWTVVNNFWSNVSTGDVQVRKQMSHRLSYRVWTAFCGTSLIVEYSVGDSSSKGSSSLNVWGASTRGGWWRLFNLVVHVLNTRYVFPDGRGTSRMSHRWLLSELGALAFLCRRSAHTKSGSLSAAPTILWAILTTQDKPY